MIHIGCETIISEPLILNGHDYSARKPKVYFRTCGPNIIDNVIHILYNAYIMKKDIVYSIRMSTLVREALKRAAKKERRTVASLLDKIILDFLEEERYLLPHETGSDRRNFQRSKITLPAITTVEVNGDREAFPCVITDIAMGGVFITYPKGSKIKEIFLRELERFNLSFKLPQTGEELSFDCDARRMVEVDGEIQVGAILNEPDDTFLTKMHSYLV